MIVASLIDWWTAAECPWDETGDRCSAAYVLRGVCANVLRVSSALVESIVWSGTDV